MATFNKKECRLTWVGPHCVILYRNAPSKNPLAYYLVVNHVLDTPNTAVVLANASLTVFI